MVSLQLLQLTEHGRKFASSRRKALAMATGLLVAGGTAAYMQSKFLKKTKIITHSIDENGHDEGNKIMNGEDESSSKDKLITGRQKNGLKSMHVLTALLLSRMGRIGAGNLLSLVAISVLRTALGNRLAKVQGFLFRAAFLHRVPSFVRLIAENLLLCFIQSTLYSTTKYMTGKLSWHFRKILTERIHEDYFKNMAYYKISHVDNRITNPEQRIASDIPRFCSELSEIVQEDLVAVMDCVLYTWRLCSYASPKYVFWILGYVLGAGTVIRNFTPSFGKLMSKEQQLEGEYRQLHSRLRTHAESVAYYGGEDREASHIQQKFSRLVEHMNLVHYDHWWFGMIQDFLLKYLGATVAVILIIEPFFSGHLRPEASVLGRAEMLSNLRYHTSVIISLFQSLGTISISARRLNRLGGFADRIHELLAVSRELSGAHENSLIQNASSRNYITEANYIEFSAVKVVTPVTGNILVDDLTLRVDAGSNLLITGPNGSGKSSLFRVLGGLWPLVSGYIVKPGVGSDLNNEIFYVPQRPYTAVGTLRDQLIYPLTSDEEAEPLTYSGMVELLKNVDLEYLLERYPLDEEINWGDELSLGEQQRLGMARLFYHRPKFAILDECTSAVTTDMEERFCAKVRAMGTSCITISHRPALVAFHDMVLSLNGEGGWSVQYKRKDSYDLGEAGSDVSNSLETNRLNDALVVQRAFASNMKDPQLEGSAERAYNSVVISASPPLDPRVSLPVFPPIVKPSNALSLRLHAMFKILVPTLLDKQGAQLLTVALLVFLRTLISDRIASLNGTTVKFVLEQDRVAFIRLIGISVIQSAASAVVAPSLRHLAAKLALGWRIRLTQHLLNNYLRNNAFYKVFQMSGQSIDADQRISHDVEKLTSDLSSLVTGMVKPSVDIIWFTWRMKLLTGRRGIAILYAYMLAGLGFLRLVSPDFGDLTSKEQQLEGRFRFAHARLSAHAESIAFFGGGAREKIMIDSRFKDLLRHSEILLKKKWLFGALDDFVTKQLPHNVTWGLSLLYALDHKGDHNSSSSLGDLAHALRFLASVVSQSFLAFGDILELNRKFFELSGGINRAFELEELLDTFQSEASEQGLADSYHRDVISDGDSISFSNVDIITPGQKFLARQLTCDVLPGRSLLVTGPNGSGKSSIFRVLRGLWPVVSGKLRLPAQYGPERNMLRPTIFYVPQRPYTCLGTLRDQIIYPLSQEEAEKKALEFHGQGNIDDGLNVLDNQLRSILENVRLTYLVEREAEGLDASPNWEDILSLGEQQRLGMARLFFQRPKFGILDECTNATSVEVEEQLYRIAQDMGVTFITSSQRPALICYHSLELRLVDGEGTWKLSSMRN